MIRYLVFAATLAVAAPLAAAGPITSGHADLDIDFTAGALIIDWKTYNPMSAGTPINNDDYAPGGNPVSVPLANAFTVPSTASFACLGAAGSTVYRLKQAQDAAQVWLGYNTQDIAAGVFTGDKVQLQIVSVVAAPPGGRFILYSTNGFGTPTFLFNTAAGACNITAFPGGGITTGLHNHAWWAFSEPGAYTIRFRATGTLVAGGTVTSADVDVPFQVP